MSNGFPVAHVPPLEPGKLPFPCLLHKITPRRRTMEIEKPMIEIVAGLGSCVRVPRINLSGTCPIRTY
jgi:hypothetical protein